MSAETDAPFQRGETWFNGGTIPATLKTGEDPPGFNYEGHEYVFEDRWYGTGLQIRVRILRNSGLINVTPGQLVKVDAVTGYFSNTVLPGTNANGVTVVEDTYSFPADEFLPPAGVPPGDLFYVVVHGPCLMTSTHSGVPTMSVLQKVVSCTANGTTSADAGCIIAQDLTAVSTGLETVIAAQIQNSIGRAMSALTSGQTSTAVLVGVGW